MNQWCIHFKMYFLGNVKRVEEDTLIHKFSVDDGMKALIDFKQKMSKAHGIETDQIKLIMMAKV